MVFHECWRHPHEVMLRGCCAVLMLLGDQNRGRSPLNAAPRLDLGPLVIGLQFHSAWVSIGCSIHWSPIPLHGRRGLQRGSVWGCDLPWLWSAQLETHSPAAVFSGITAINGYGSAAFAAKGTPFFSPRVIAQGPLA